MNKKTLHKFNALHPCGDACNWLGDGHFKTTQAAWDACDRGDWMLWLLGKLSGKPKSSKRKKLVLASCGCARLALKFVKASEHRPRICIETAEAWAEGKATIKQVREARSAAADAADAAADAAAYAAAYAAANAADAAAYAADAAAYAAAYAAANAAANAAAYAAAARKKMLKKCAQAVRKFYPKAPRL